MLKQQNTEPVIMKQGTFTNKHFTDTKSKSTTFLKLLHYLNIFIIGDNKKEKKYFLK